MKLGTLPSSASPESAPTQCVLSWIVSISHKYTYPVHLRLVTASRWHYSKFSSSLIFELWIEGIMLEKITTKQGDQLPSINRLSNLPKEYWLTPLSLELCFLFGKRSSSHWFLILQWTKPVQIANISPAKKCNQMHLLFCNTCTSLQLCTHTSALMYTQQAYEAREGRREGY